MTQSYETVSFGKGRHESVVVHYSIVLLPNELVQSLRHPFYRLPTIACLWRMAFVSFFAPARHH